MKIEKLHDSIRYTLSNKNLKVDDQVFPIGRGRCLDDGGWILHNLDFREFMSGFPNQPHTILELKYSKSKPYEVQTNMAFSPIESYFKIIKMEETKIAEIVTASDEVLDDCSKIAIII